MTHRNNTTAWRIIDGANDRWDAEPERIENEGDAGLIVAGATLEETENLAAAVKDLSKAIEALTADPPGPSWTGKLSSSMIHNVPPFAGMGGLLFLLSAIGVI